MLKKRGIKSNMTGIKVFRTPLSFGLVVNDTKYINTFLTILEPIIKRCHMPDCKNDAVRVGVYPLLGNNSTEYRGLCDRHKSSGMWD